MGGRRWVIFVVTSVLVPAAVWFLWYRASKSSRGERKAPVAGMVAAGIAFGAWGLVMPGGPLTYSIDKASSLTIWTFIIVTVATAVISVLPLTKQAT